jgi:hypothetical protein
LKTVKICGLARAQMDIPKHHQVAKPIQNLKKDEVTFTAIDILASSKWYVIASLKHKNGCVQTLLLFAQFVNRAM